MFQNPAIALHDLPNTDDLDWEPLHSSYARKIRVFVLGLFIPIAAGIACLGFVPNIPLLPFIILYAQWVLAFVISMIWPSIAVPRQGYVLRDKDIMFRKGVIWRSVTAVPFNRIQHVETSSTPLDRKFGLATLQLFTAGGSSGDLKIDGLGADVAEQLRVYILNKAGASVENTGA